MCARVGQIKIININIQAINLTNIFLLLQRMFALPPSMEQRFQLYLNILPAVEQGAMYLLFTTGAILIIITIYRLTFKIMFKSFDSNKKRNIIIGTDLWIEQNKSKKYKDSVYVPCEIPLSETDTDYNTDYDPQIDNEKRPTIYKTHSDRLKELSSRLSDKVYDSVGSIKDKVRDIAHVKSIFKNEQSTSLIQKNESQSNEAYKSDSSDSEKEYKGNYEPVRQSDSDDDCKYLEVLDDGCEFDDSIPHHRTERSNHLKDLESTDKNDLIIHISDSD